VKRGGNITAVSIYKTQHGRKGIASASDGTQQGKDDLKKTWSDDNKQKRAWGEVSGAVEHIKKTKLGTPVVPNHMAAKLTGKPIIAHHPDGAHYTRTIGGHAHTKVIVGHPKLSD
jgi:cell division protein FtsL